MIDLRLLGGVAVANPTAAGDAPAPRRRAFALLALVAAAHPQPIARDKLLALLWPESDSARARNSLRQTIFALRRDLNEELFLPESRGGLQLDAAHLQADLWRFRDAIARDALEEAASVYGGPFLDGFHVPGLSAFAQWMDAERDRLERQHLGAIDALARRALDEGRHDDAIAWRRRLAAADPLSARATLGLLQVLAAAGERAEALKHAAAHERLVRQELETEPDPIVTKFVDELRRNATPASVRRLSPEQPPVAITRAPAPIPIPVTARRSHKTLGRLTVAVAALLVTGMAGKWVAAAVTSTRPTPIVLGSGLRDISSRDPSNRLVACSGPACPKGRLPIDAYIVAPHPAYGPPSPGTHYIAPVPDATQGDTGYRCCTTAAFENDFHLPPDALSATVTVEALADNQAIVAVNGVEFGRQRDKLGPANFAAYPTRFVATFVPDPSGTNRLRVTLWDGGGALGLEYSATVTYETAASRHAAEAKAAK